MGTVDRPNGWPIAIAKRDIRAGEKIEFIYNEHGYLVENDDIKPYITPQDGDTMTED